MRREQAFIVGAIAALGILFGAGFALASPAGEALSAPDVAKGAQVYKNNCAACHGNEGEGKLGIPNLAGAAGHVQQLGVPAEQAAPGIVKLLRDGIPGNMPAFPPSILSDQDIGDLGAYLFTLPPTSGANLYTANCALCHGLRAEGAVGPPLAGAAERFAALGITKLQLLRTFPDLARKGIPGKMPGNPQLADVEVTSLGDYLWNLGSWQADFQTLHGHTPTARDRADREWSQQFALSTGRTPSDADWIAHFTESQKYQQVTALDVSIGAPPAGGWKWVVAGRTTGAADDVEVNTNPDDHGNEWVFHVLKGAHEMSIPGASVVLGEREAELLLARTLHTHRFVAQSAVLQFRVHAATARPPGAFHRGERLLFSDTALETTPGTVYKLRVRDFTLAAGQAVPGTIAVGPSFAYAVEGTVSLSPAGTVAAGTVLSLAPTQSLVLSNPGTGDARLVLVDLH